MIYTGEFTAIGRIDVKTTYTIKIVTEQGTEEKTITLGDTPFIVEYEGDDENIYKPVRYSSATIKIISPDYNFDIYSGKAQGTGIYVTDSSDIVVWNGYATPNLYDMGYKRVGCIGCPQKGKKGMLEDFKRFPKYKENYIKAFERMLKVRKEKGLETTWKTGEEVFNWWINQ